MYKLTKKRLEKAKHIIDEYNENLKKKKSYNEGAFERKLRDCWNIGYQELKSIVEDLSKKEEYKYLAVYYMEHSNFAVVSEFKPVLAKFYGMKCYDSKDRKAKQKEFWDKF